MSTELKNTDAATPANNGKCVTKEQQQKIDDLRSGLGPLPEKLSWYCSDAIIGRYLQVNNGNVQKGTKMLKECLKWRSEYKPDEILWIIYNGVLSLIISGTAVQEDVAFEAETGKVYRSASVDKKGRPVIVMRPCRQNSSNIPGQMKYLVYCIENSMLNMPPDQEEMIWVVDFWNFKLSNISMGVSKELSHIMQNYYPDRLGVAVLYNPPWIFEQFYKHCFSHNSVSDTCFNPIKCHTSQMVKPFLGARIRDKVKFVYSNDSTTMKIMEDLFETEQFESVLGSKAAESFDIHTYAQWMKKEDEKRRFLGIKGNEARKLSVVGELSEEEKAVNGEQITPSTTEVS
ncbi:hypothetical protein KSS87_006432 [Heliosperma pusillum]|nr:hypothetical protein KSS87_006432 [Heliosperma pusillum]